MIRKQFYNYNILDNIDNIDNIDNLDNIDNIDNIDNLDNIDNIYINDKKPLPLESPTNQSGKFSRIHL